MSAHSIFLVSNELFETWMQQLGRQKIVLSKSGSQRVTEEGVHQVWEAYLDGKKIFWLEFLTQKIEKRDLLIVGPLLNKEEREVFQKLLSILIDLGAKSVKSV